MVLPTCRSTGQGVASKDLNASIWQYGTPFFLCIIKAKGVWSVWSSRSILVLLKWFTMHGQSWWPLICRTKTPRKSWSPHRQWWNFRTLGDGTVFNTATKKWAGAKWPSNLAIRPWKLSESGLIQKEEMISHAMQRCALNQFSLHNCWQRLSQQQFMPQPQKALMSGGERCGPFHQHSFCSQMCTPPWSCFHQQHW